MGNLSVLSSRVKQSKKDARNMYVCSYLGNDVGSEWFSENMMPANRYSGVLGLLDP